MNKRRNCSSGAISPLFHNSFNVCILCKGVKLYVNLGNLVVIFFFLNSGNLICRSTGMLMYFRESLGVRDNESRLYIPTKDISVVSHAWQGEDSSVRGFSLGGGDNTSENGARKFFFFGGGGGSVLKLGVGGGGG